MGVYIYKQVVTAQPTVTFKIAQCTDMNPYEGPQSGILNQKWLDNEILQVEGFVKINCAWEITVAKSHIERDTIILEYNEEKQDMMTACMCTKKVIFKITDIPYKEYNVSLVEK